jgi:hypothetical protein
VSLAEVLLRLNLEQVRRFIAYLRFLDRRFNPAQESLEPGAGAESDYFRAIRTIGEALPRGCTSDAYPGCLVDMRKLSRAARCEAFRGKSDPQSTTHLVDAKVAEPHGLDPEKTTAFVNEFYRWFDSDQASISDETAYLLLRWFRDEPRTVGVLELTTRCFVCRSLSESERHRANSGKSARGANEDRESSQV